MRSLVLELQEEARKSEAPVSDLLRTALMVANKLEIKEFEDWITFELNGYQQNSQIPEYRKVRGEIKYLNLYNNCWCPVIFGDHEIAENLSTRKSGQPIRTIEDLLKDKNSSGTLQMPFSKEIESMLMTGGEGIPFPPKLVISANSLAGIVDIVRTTVLKWALKLEEDGILGEGMTFLPNEKQAAQTAQYQIVNFYGQSANQQVQIGTEHSSQHQISQTINLEEVERLLLAIRGIVSEVELTASQKDQLKSQTETIENEISESTPDSSKIKENLQSVKTILEGATGGTVATGLTNLIGWLSSLL